MNRKRARYIVTSVVLAMAAVSTMGLANVFSMSGTVTVDEALTVDPVELTFFISPGESVPKTVTVHNISGNEVWGSAVMSVDDPFAGLSLSLTEDIFQPIAPGGQADWNFTIEADNGAQPGEHTLDLDVYRPDDTAIENFLAP